MKYKTIYYASNCLVCFDIIRGKNCRNIFNNIWRKVDDIQDCSWQEMAKYCKVKGGY